MAHRPFPVLPRGPRRLRQRSPQLLFACPRLSPQWELGALRALIKPQTGKGLEHQTAGQAWPEHADEIVTRVVGEVDRRLGFRPGVSLHAEGDYHLVAQIDPNHTDEAKAFAAVLSRALPSLWSRLGRLHLRAGAFYRRERGYKLTLVPAPDVHLRRDLRAAVRDLL